MRLMVSVGYLAYSHEKGGEVLKQEMIGALEIPDESRLRNLTVTTPGAILLDIPWDEAATFNSWRTTLAKKNGKRKAYKRIIKLALRELERVE